MVENFFSHLILKHSIILLRDEQQSKDKVLQVVCVYKIKGKRNDCKTFMKNLLFYCVIKEKGTI